MVLTGRAGKITTPTIEGLRSQGVHGTVYAFFEKIGLRRHNKARVGKRHEVQTTMTAGTFDDASAAKARNDIAGHWDRIFSANSLRGEIFVCVGVIGHGDTMYHNDAKGHEPRRKH
jgi:hypothetical protein